MATRLNRLHSDAVVRRIRTSQLIQRLQKHALGELRGPAKEANPEGDLIRMTDSQVRAACFLIERTLSKAEAPKNVNVSGQVTLVQLLTAAMQAAEEQETRLDS